MLYKYPYQSELGTITLLANDHGLLGAWFENQANFGGTFDIARVDEISEIELSPIINATVNWLDAYCKRQAPDKVGIQLMPQGTAFQQDVWTQILKIPYGLTITTQELAEKVAARQTKGDGTVKAIIGAVKNNPIAIVIPSHRVLIEGDMDDSKLTSQLRNRELD